MAYILKVNGFPVIPGLPAIALEEGAYDQTINLTDWLRLVEIDESLEEVIIPEERPHYRFRNKKNEEIIIAYYFGYIVPQDSRNQNPEEIMQEYADHLNELNKRVEPGVLGNSLRSRLHSTFDTQKGRGIDR